VAARLGPRLTLALSAGAGVKPGSQFRVGRARLLAVVAKGQERIEAWGDWEEAGRIRVWRLRGKSCADALVEADAPRKGPSGQRVPNIRPGDTVYVPAGDAPTPAKKPGVPPTRKGR
jgi:hypothetical protein